MNERDENCSSIEEVLNHNCTQQEADAHFEKYTNLALVPHNRITLRMATRGVQDFPRNIVYIPHNMVFDVIKTLTTGEIVLYTQHLLTKFWVSEYEHLELEDKDEGWEEDDEEDEDDG